jgi:hypothetical protein
LSQTVANMPGRSRTVRHPAGSRASSTRGMTSASSTTVEHADVVSSLLFLRLVGSCRHQSGRADETSLADDSLSWASEECIGSDPSSRLHSG